MLRTPFDLGELASPGGAIPDLEVIVDARDDDVADELRVLQQRTGNPDPALFVELAFHRSGIEVALEPATLLAQGVELRETRFDRLRPVGTGIGVQAPVEAAAHDHALREGLTKAGRKREAALVIDRVLVLTEKHSGPVLCLPLLPTINHISPLRNPFGPPKRVIYAERRAARASATRLSRTPSTSSTSRSRRFAWTLRPAVSRWIEASRSRRCTGPWTRRKL